MLKYWGKQIFSLGSFPEAGQKQKTEKKERRERLNDGNNNDQLCIANAAVGVACKATWTNVFFIMLITGKKYSYILKA